MNKFNKRLTINFTFPLHDKDFNQGGWLIFYKWVPKKDANAILVSEGNKTAKIYADKSCIWSIVEKTDEEINNLSNVTVSKLKVDVEVSNIDDELLNFIFNERDRNKQIHHDKQPCNEDFKILQVQYEMLGKEVYDLAFSVFNRFLSYARNIKGQYWHNEKKYSDCEYTAKAQIDDGNFFRWSPSLDNSGTILVTMDGVESFIHQEDWVTITKYVQSKHRPKLTLELLANSRNLGTSKNHPN